MMQIKEIKKWEIDHDVTHTMIAKDANVSQPLVTMVLKGERKSKKIIEAFIRRGCPGEFFGKDKADGTSQDLEAQTEDKAGCQKGAV